jgi:hypothetical protein
MELLKWVGGFIQQTATTNTAVEVAGSIADIHYDHKRARGIACLVTAVVGMAGGAALFVLEPSIHLYFNSIILNSFPFLGAVAPTVFTGIIGAWFGGGFGHNVAKECAREYAERNLGHSNAAYTFTDQDILRIVEENPQIYNYNFDPEQGVSPEQIDNIKARDVQDLKNLLLLIRDQIDEHKNDGTVAHDENKYSLLSALRLSNLLPLIELVNKSDTKREVRKQAALKIANYMTDTDAGRLFGEPPQVPRQARAPRGRNARRRAAAAQPAAAHVEVAVPIANLPPVLPAGQAGGPGEPLIEIVPLIDEAPVPRGMQPVLAQRARALHQEVLVNPGAVIFENLRSHIHALNQGEVKDVRRVKRNVEANNKVHVLTAYEKHQLLESLKNTYQEQNTKQINGRRSANPILEKALHRVRA